MDDEEVIYQTHVHWIVFMPWFLLTMAVLSIMFFYPHNKTIVIIVRIIASVLFLKAIGNLVFYWTSEYGVTTRRVLGKTGLITVRSLDILLQKVEAIRLKQGILGRMLNFGDLIVTGTGGTSETLFDVPDPLSVRNLIQEQVSKNAPENQSVAHNES
jgi:uncharacterized membrane protein YdbT with pleckstrin-like domain